MWHALTYCPRQVGLRDVALSVRADCQEARCVITGADEDKPLSVDWPRHDRIAAVTYPPDLPTRPRIIPVNRIAGRADDLLLVADRDEQWRTERELAVALTAPIGFPPHAPSLPVTRADTPSIPPVPFEY